QGAVDDDERDRSDRRNHDSIEERSQRIRPAEQEPHEESELDVAETQRLAFEDRRTEERQEQKQQPRAQAHQERVAEWPPQDYSVGYERSARPPRLAQHRQSKRERHRRKDHPVQDQVVLEIEKDHLHQNEHEDA